MSLGVSVQVVKGAAVGGLKHGEVQLSASCCIVLGLREAVEQVGTQRRFTAAGPAMDWQCFLMCIPCACMCQ